MTENPSAVDFPQMILLETTNACNLRCVACPRLLDDYTKQGLRMQIEVWERIRPFLKYIQHLALVGCGEPLMDNRIFDFVKEAAAQNVYVMFTTNGTLLSPDIKNRILHSGLSLLGISIDSASEKSFRHIRNGASLIAIKENARAFIQMRDLLGERPIVKIQALIFNENLHELPEMVQMAADLGANEFYAKNPFLFHKNLANGELTIETRTEEENKERQLAVEKALITAERLGIRAVFPDFQRRREFDCSCHPQQQLYVRRGGEIYPCSLYAVIRSEEMIMGNLLEESFDEIWQHEKYQTFRDNFKNRRINFCLSCPLWGQEYSSYSPKPISSYCY